MPGGWGGGPAGTIFADDKVVHGGRWSARIERRVNSPSQFSTITKSIPIDFSGATIELRGFLRTEDVDNFAGLWMREDGESPSLAFENMQNRQLKGTTPWTEYEIKLPVHPEAKRLFFGVLVAGSGKAWADDLQLLVDGRPVWDAPKADRPKTVFDDDHEFDSGSRVSINELTNVQIDNLVILGKVWGFLKYYHPSITSGNRHWDYDLFRVLPAVLEARDHTLANAVLANWIDKLGKVDACDPCLKMSEVNLKFGPDLDWISDVRVLGAELSHSLIEIRDNRSGKQFYVSKVPEIGNPSFNHELAYADVRLPDSGYQLLALYRFWNIIEYWSPYRDVLGEDWNGVLAEFIPRIALAKNPESYKKELLALVAKANDGHANLWGSLDVRPPVGKCQLPVDLRFAENLPTISEFTSADPKDDVALKKGDVITELDGVAVTRSIEEWKPYYAASNEAARLRDIGRAMTRGECGDATVEVRRGDQQLKLKVDRVPPPPADSSGHTHDLRGPTFRLLSKDVAYLKLSSVKSADCAHYVEEAAGTKGLIIDIRNYPSEFVVFSLGSLLVANSVPFARFTEPDLSTPGASYWANTVTLSPQKPHYSGKVVILVDESSMSQAEYTSMALRAVHGSIVIGSTTAGADGNVSPFALPGGLRTMISGIGVFYPDKGPTQRIGIVPNVQVKPSIAAIRAGRDEVLEEAVRQIVGQQVPLKQIEDIANPHR
ncbi:MAG: S41 family peptidase [Terriglobales bacterium]